MKSNNNNLAGSFKAITANQSTFEGIVLQENQISEFTVWLENKAWEKFFLNHYDWYTFPIDKPSLSCSSKYCVRTKLLLDHLRGEHRFLSNIKKATELVLFAWGWSIRDNQLLVNRWENNKNPTRLYKIGRCLKLFDLHDHYDSLIIFAKTVNATGVLSMWSRMEQQGFEIDFAEKKIIPWL